MNNIKNLENLNQLKDQFRKELSKVIIGQNKIIDQIFIAL